MLKAIRLILKVLVPSFTRIARALEEQNRILSDIRVFLRRSAPLLGPDEEEEPEKLSSYSVVDEEEDAKGEIRDLVKRFGSDWLRNG